MRLLVLGILRIRRVASRPVLISGRRDFGCSDIFGCGVRFFVFRGLFYRVCCVRSGVFVGRFSFFRLFFVVFSVFSLVPWACVSGVCGAACPGFVVCVRVFRVDGVWFWGFVGVSVVFSGVCDTPVEWCVSNGFRGGRDGRVCVFAPCGVSFSLAAAQRTVPVGPVP